MARLTRRRRVVTALALIVAIAALSTGAWALKRWAPFEHGDHFPTAWPKNITPVAAFVENVTGVDFEHPIAVRFLSQKNFDRETARAPRTAAARKAFDDRTAWGRALGLWSGDFSFAAAEDAVVASTRPANVFLRADNELLVRAAGGGATLDTVTRADLAYVLTAALQEQRFHVLSDLKAATTSIDVDRLAALATGQSEWVASRYVASFDSTDRHAFDTAINSASTTFQTVYARQPAALRLQRDAPRLAGATFFEELQETDRSLAARALSTDRPQAIDQIELADGKYLTRDPLEAVDALVAPRGTQRVASGHVGPVNLYLMLAAAVPPQTALSAADGWGNDSYVSYRRDGVLCVDLHLVGDSPQDTAGLFTQLGAWARTRPASAGALLARKDDSIYVTVCDPGTKAAQQVPNDDAYTQFLDREVRIKLDSDRLNNPREAECIWVQVYGALPAQWVSTGGPSGSAVGATVKKFRDECAKVV